MQNPCSRIVAACALTLAAAAQPAFAGTALDEANRSFTYEARPIHPYLVQEFENWLSDFRAPMTTSVDVAAAADSNEYAAAVTDGEGAMRCAAERDADGKLGPRGSFCYRHVGRLQNGAHVLKTISSSEGSGAFASLVLVRFDEGTIVWQGHVEPQLRMSVVGVQALRPGEGGNLKLSGNKVLISAAADPANPAATRPSGTAPVYQELDFAQAVVAAPAVAAAAKPAATAAPKPAVAPTVAATAPQTPSAASSKPAPAVASTGDGPFQYRCGSGATVTATYYPDEDRAAVSYRGKTAQMKIAMSASGARYLGGGWVWWTRGATEGSLFTAMANGETGGQLEQCTATDDAADK